MPPTEDLAGLVGRVRIVLVGGVGAIVAGSSVYVLVQVGIVDVGLAPVVVALGASAAAMLLGGFLGPQESEEMIGQIEALHG